MSEFLETFIKSLKCNCPRCGKGKIFSHFFKFEPQDQCPSCGLKLSEHDNADGPAVFLIFILGFTIVPLALWVDHLFSPSLLVHSVVWSVLLIALILGSLKPIKSYIMALQYKYKPDIWDEK